MGEEDGGNVESTVLTHEEIEITQIFHPVNGWVYMGEVSGDHRE